MAEQMCELCGENHGSSIGEAMATNPTVHGCMQLHFSGRMSYEQALILAVVHLARSERLYRSLLVKAAGSIEQAVKVGVVMGVGA